MNKQEAIKILDNERKEYIVKGCKLDKAIDMAIEALQDDWTPVSEGLPDEDDDVNVTLKDFPETRTGFYVEEGWWLITE